MVLRAGALLSQQSASVWHLPSDKRTFLIISRHTIHVNAGIARIDEPEGLQGLSLLFIQPAALWPCVVCYCLASSMEAIGPPLRNTVIGVIRTVDVAPEELLPQGTIHLLPPASERFKTSRGARALTKATARTQDIQPIGGVRAKLFLAAAAANEKRERSEIART